MARIVKTDDGWRLDLRGPVAQMINYQMAKYILAALGMQMHRLSDATLAILLRPADQTGSWFNGENPDTTVRVDEGVFTDVLRSDGIGLSMRAEELVPWRDFLRVLARFYAPDAEIKPSPYIGTLRSNNYYAQQYSEILLAAKLDPAVFVIPAPQTAESS
jgi:hypothetical protein